jgi:hypothetical protein
MSGKLFALLATLAAFNLWTAAADGADIRLHPTADLSSSAIFEGPIEKGDYDKVVRFMFQYPVVDVILASPGGDAAEAMRIGRVFRALKVVTSLPGAGLLSRDVFPLEPILLKDPKADFMCRRACFFALVGGIYRSETLLGPRLGFDRPYLTAKDLRELGGDKAVPEAEQTRSIIGNYLRKMGVPARYAEAMFSLSVGDTRLISYEDFQIDLGLIPELKLRGLADARCPPALTSAEEATWYDLEARANEEYDREARAREANNAKDTDWVSLHAIDQDDPEFQERRSLSKKQELRQHCENEFALELARHALQERH